MIWDNFAIFKLKQITPSRAALAHTYCEDVCGCSAGEMATKIPEIIVAFDPQLNAFMSVAILLKYVRRKLYNLCEVRQCRI